MVGLHIVCALVVHMYVHMYVYMYVIVRSLLGPCFPCMGAIVFS